MDSARGARAQIQMERFPTLEATLEACKAIWKREFKLPWREAGPPDHHDDKVDSDQ